MPSAALLLAAPSRALVPRRSQLVVSQRQRPCARRAAVLPELAEAAGTAYDGSPWVTAVSSVGLVIGVAASAGVGALLIVRGIERGVIDLSEDFEGSQGGRTIKPLEVAR